LSCDLFVPGDELSPSKNSRSDCVDMLSPLLLQND